MAESANGVPNQGNHENQSDFGPTAADYMARAAKACTMGDVTLGMHLYLAAAEAAAASGSVSTSTEVSALREAWNLACALGERSLAEYVFEKLEPFLTSEEISECALKLQDLALDHLEQFGFTREELESMAETISNDLFGVDAHVVKLESISIPAVGAVSEPGERVEAVVAEGSLRAGESDGADPDVPGDPMEVTERTPKPSQVDMGVADVSKFNPYDEYRTSSVGKSYHAATNEGAGNFVFTLDDERAGELARFKSKGEAEGRAQAGEPAHADEGEPAGLNAAQNAAPSASSAASAEDAREPEPGRESDGATAADPSSDAAPAEPQAEFQAGSQAQPETASATQAIEGQVQAQIQSAAPAKPAAPAKSAAPAQRDDGILRYGNLVGYNEAIAAVRGLGIGKQGDPGFITFVQMLNYRHGLESMPAVDTLLFRAAAIEDAERFAEATIGELGLPVLRMSMEEGAGGIPVLCVTTSGNNRPRMNHAHNRFEGPGILVLEDLNSWFLPDMQESPEGFGGFVMANVSRGAREAMNLIRSAVEDPDVYVLSTASLFGEADPFFYDLLEPITIVDIANPNDNERAAIWSEIARDHPSIRGVDLAMLTRLSKGLSRFDIRMAAREAVEDAYKLGLANHAYMPVSAQVLLGKIAACLPQDSPQYQMVEEAVLELFRNDIGELDDLLDDFR